MSEPTFSDDDVPFVTSSPKTLAEIIVEKIDHAYAMEPEDKARSYIGASSIGTKCDAEIAYSLRGFPGTPPEPRTKRIFRDGHRIERTVVSDLRKAGFRILEVDETTGRQWRFELAGGHIVCNTDGLIDIEGNEQLDLLEIKSMNNRMFTTFKSKGVKVSHPKYWDQIQMMGGMGALRRCVFIAYNKDNSEYWVEIVEIDPMEWAFIKTRIETVWRGEAAKVSSDPASFLCRFCFKQGVCWEGKAVESVCRTCAHASPTTDGGWWCREHDAKAISPCSSWQVYKPMDKE